MDKLFTGDIPKNYKYARFNSSYVDLFNTPVLHSNNYDYYRIHFTDYGFYYEKLNITVSQYQSFTLQELDVTDNVSYRQDFPQICQVTFIIVFFAIFLFNIFTSVVRKGGLLGGLL